MRTFVILFLFSCISQLGYAQTQDTTEVYTSLRVSKDSLRKKWRPVLRKNNGLFELSFYDKKGIIQETINYENAQLEVRKGPYLRYDNGKLIIKGNYEKGYKHGEWLVIREDGTNTKEFYKYGKNIAHIP